MEIGLYSSPSGIVVFILADVDDSTYGTRAGAIAPNFAQKFAVGLIADCCERRLIYLNLRNIFTE
jgi:hypothetical protein